MILPSYIPPNSDFEGGASLSRGWASLAERFGNLMTPRRRLQPWRIKGRTRCFQAFQRVKATMGLAVVILRATAKNWQGNGQEWSEAERSCLSPPFGCRPP